MSNTANLNNADLYQQDDNDDPMENIDENYDPGLEDDQKGLDEDIMDQRELDRKFNDLLFCVQGVGSYKEINGMQVYVKHEHCLESLKDIYKHLKNDGSAYPFIRLTLGNWNFFEKDLIPLVKFHKQDKKLSFLATMIMINLTSVPAENCTKVSKLISQMRLYKDLIIRSNVTQTLMEHLADCLQKEQRNEKHEQMIELIIILFKQLLTIPDASQRETSDVNLITLQKRLLLHFSEESVLDSFIYLTQDFSQDIQKKLSPVFLEIWYSIFKNFTPQQIFTPEEGLKNAQEEIMARERARERRQNFIKGIRHSKFGSQLQIKRDDGSSALISNIYQANIDIHTMQKNQRIKPVAKKTKDPNQMIESTESQLIIHEAALEVSDKKLLELLKNHLVDLLDNSYCGLIEQLQKILSGESTIERNDQDTYQYFKFTTFILQVCRYKAYEVHKELKQKAVAEAKAQQSKDEQNRLLGISKGKQPAKLNVAKVPFEIDISTIGASLQLSNFQFLYGVLYSECMKNKKKDRKMRDFHSGLQFLTQFLYIIRDMASSEDERNKKNATILQQNIFYHDLCKISKVALVLYEQGAHSKQLLHDAIEFTHIMVDMLEEYSKGKVLTIQTQRKKKVKKAKKNNENKDDEEEEEFDPNKPDVFRDPMEDDDSLAEESDDDVEEKFVERQFNFVSEISIFVDYQVITKYLMIVKDKDYKKNPMLLQGVNSMLKRITNQIKATWIFFQFEYLLIFQQVVNEGHINNHLMQNINQQVAFTARDRQVDSLQNELKQLLINIIRQFLDALQKNKLLAVESFFHFTSREHKDSILTNYDGMQAPSALPLPIQDEEEDEFKELPQSSDDDEQNAKQQPEQEIDIEDIIKYQWTQEQDNTLIDNYEQFKDLGKKKCFKFLSTLIDGKLPKECYKRAKILKLIKQGTAAAREISNQLNAEKPGIDLTKAKVAISLKQYLTAKSKQNGFNYSVLRKQLTFIERVRDGFIEFKQAEENLFLFGLQQDISDYQRVNIHYTVIITERDDFEQLKDADFVRFLSTLNIKYSESSNLFPKIQSTIKKDVFNENIDTLLTLCGDIQTETGGISSEKVEQLDSAIEFKMSAIEEEYERRKLKKKLKKIKMNKQADYDVDLDIDVIEEQQEEGEEEDQ